jgi:putative transcriptional regulator
MDPSDSGTLKAKLLVATPMLGDPNFDRTVVWLLEHGEEGALGVVLNRPSDLPVADPLPSWADHTEPLSVVFLGGPVSTNSVIGLARLSGDGPDGAWEQVLGTVGVLDLTADPLLLAPALTGLRCFAGYAGWGPDQLETEIEEGAWFVLDADPADPFTDAPEALWRSVLARQRNELARVALVPDDPTMN